MRTPAPARPIPTEDPLESGKHAATAARSGLVRVAPRADVGSVTLKQDPAQLELLRKRAVPGEPDPTSRESDPRCLVDTVRLEPPSWSPPATPAGSSSLLDLAAEFHLTGSEAPLPPWPDELEPTAVQPAVFRERARARERALTRRRIARRVVLVAVVALAVLGSAAALRTGAPQAPPDSAPAGAHK